jgi:hypothetical protein
MYPNGHHGNRQKWCCSIQKRLYEQAWYDRDPVHRIEKNLRNDALKRRQTIQRRKAAWLPKEGGQ